MLHVTTPELVQGLLTAVELRNKYLPKYYTNNCNRHKLILLLKNVEHPKIGIPFGFFLKETKVI